MNAPHWRDASPADYAVVGDPIGHSWSPLMQNAAFRALGLELRYSAIRVPAGELAEAATHLRAAGFRGLNVTVPLKEEAFALASELDAESSRYGAANVLELETLRGHNTDGPAFMNVLRRLGVEPCRALVLGAGGTARTLAVALGLAGFEVAIHNRTPQKAARLSAEIGVRHTLQASARGCSLVVDATSSSLTGGGPLVEWSGASPDALAFAAAYGVPSRFLEAAAAAGLRTQDGAEMLVEQGALSLEWWLGVEAPREAMREAIRR